MSSKVNRFHKIKENNVYTVKSKQFSILWSYLTARNKRLLLKTLLCGRLNTYPDFILLLSGYQISVKHKQTTAKQCTYTDSGFWFVLHAVTSTFVQRSLKRQKKSILMQWTNSNLSSRISCLVCCSHTLKSYEESHQF